MTRDEVLNVLQRVVPLRRRRIDPSDVAVHFMQKRIGVVLPAEQFPADVRVRLDGQFQYLMTQKHGAHAFLDFSDQWKGRDTALTAGFQ